MVAPPEGVDTERCPRRERGLVPLSPLSPSRARCPRAALPARGRGTRRRHARGKLRGNKLPLCCSRQPLQEHSPMAGGSVPGGPGRPAPSQAGPPPASLAAGRARAPERLRRGSGRSEPHCLCRPYLQPASRQNSALHGSLPLKPHWLINYSRPFEGVRATGACSMREALRWPEGNRHTT